MPANEENSQPCPECGTRLIDGYLTGPVEFIHVASMQSLEPSSLQALVCPRCGHIELRAEEPHKLTDEDISEDELPE